MASNIPYPTDELVELAMSMTEYYDRDTLISALQAKNNDLQAVMNEWFDDSEKFKKTYSWDDSAFSSGREGDQWGNQQTPSFLIQAPDEGPALHGRDPHDTSFYPGGPSRPPSRANNVSPMSRIADIATNSFAPNSREQENEQLQRALEESLHTSGAATPAAGYHNQDSGVLPMASDGSRQFGPANRSEYNPQDWSMIRMEDNEQDPEPSRRQREPEAPVFLRCRELQTWCQHRVGHILTILHTIPAARNFFLRIGSPPESGYGNDQHWWKGNSILLPQYQAALMAEREIDPETKTLQWIAELHRLNAVLDSSERSYATADVLAGGQDGALDPEKDFFEHLTEGLSGIEHPDINPLESEVLYAPFDAETTIDASSFSLFDLGAVPAKMGEMDNLYKFLDHIFYHESLSGQDNDSANIASLTKIADVIPLRVCTDLPLQKMLDVPETLYLDRYMKSNREVMKALLVDMNKMLKAQVKGDAIEERLTKFVDPNTNEVLDVKQVMLDKIKYSEHRINVIECRRQWLDFEDKRMQFIREGKEEPDDFYYLPGKMPAPNLTEEDQAGIDNHRKIIAANKNGLTVREQRFENLTKQREWVASILEKQRSLLTGPYTLDPKFNATHKYSLRGVTSTLDTVYIRKREADLMDLELGTEPAEQWWKYRYEPGHEGSVIRSEKISFEQVLREACSEGCRPILVYASEKALNETLAPLEEGLRSFVRLDNRHFKAELNHEPLRETKRPGFVDPASPTKRNRFRSKSIDSLASNRASVGSMDNDSGLEADLLSGDGPTEGNITFFDDGPALPEMQERKHVLGAAKPSGPTATEDSIIDQPIAADVAETLNKQD